MNDWVDVTEDLPVLERGLKYTSVAVLVRMYSQRITMAVYNYLERRWYKAGNGERLRSPVVEWRSV